MKRSVEFKALVIAVILINTAMRHLPAVVYFTWDTYSLIVAACIPLLLPVSKPVKAVSVGILFAMAGHLIDKAYFDRWFFGWNDVATYIVAIIAMLAYHKLHKGDIGKGRNNRGNFALTIYFFLISIPTRLLPHLYADGSFTNFEFYLIGESILHVLISLLVFNNTTWRNKIVAGVWLALAGHNMVDQIGNTFSPKIFQSSIFSSGDKALSTIIYTVGTVVYLYSYQWVKDFLKKIKIVSPS